MKLTTVLLVTLMFASGCTKGETTVVPSSVVPNPEASPDVQKHDSDADETAVVKNTKVTRELATVSWHVEKRNGVDVCVPSSVTHKKRKVKKKIAKKKVVCPVVIATAAPKCVEHEKQVVVEKTVEVEAKTPKNRIRLMGGQGLSSSNITVNPASVLFTKKYGLVVGAGYERSLTKEWSVGAEVLSNPTWLLTVGYSF